MRCLYLSFSLATACLALAGDAYPQGYGRGGTGSPYGPGQPGQSSPAFTPAPVSPGLLPANTREVVMEDNQFSPGVIAVRAGTLIVWRNRDHHVHTVTSPRMGLDSGPIQPGQQYSAYAGPPGDYPYYCRIHGELMDGTIIVY